MSVDLQSITASAIEHNGEFVGAILSSEGAGRKIHSLKSLIALHAKNNGTVRLGNSLIGATGRVYAIHGLPLEVIEASTLPQDVQKSLGIL